MKRMKVVRINKEEFELDDGTIQPMMEGAVMDKIKSIGKNTIVPLLVSVCMSAGLANAKDINECKSVYDCEKTLTELKEANTNITTEEMDKVKELAEKGYGVAYCKVFPRGILCKNTPHTPFPPSFRTVSQFSFVPVSSIECVPDDITTIEFTNIEFKDGSVSRKMLFSSTQESIEYVATSYSTDNTKGEVNRYDEFSELTVEEYSYQSVLNFINKVYKNCRH